MSGRRAGRSALHPVALHPVGLHSVGLGLSAGLFAVILGLAAILIAVPFLAGATPLTILTSSMEPRLPPGTLIVVKPKPVDEIQIGDVVTYQIRSGHPEVVSHRVVRVNSSSDGKRSFVTQGDNNAIADASPVVAGQIKGALWYSVPWIGYLSTAVNGQNRSWIVPAIAVAILGYAGFMLAGGIVDAMRKRRPRDREPAAVSERVAAER